MTGTEMSEAVKKCPTCKGNGRVEILEHCPTCEGTGEISPAEPFTNSELDLARVVVANVLGIKDVPPFRGRLERRWLATIDERDAQISRLKELLVRLRQWDILDVAGDGSYWKKEVDEVLRG